MQRQQRNQWADAVRYEPRAGAFRAREFRHPLGFSRSIACSALVLMAGLAWGCSESDTSTEVANLRLACHGDGSSELRVSCGDDHTFECGDLANESELTVDIKRTDGQTCAIEDFSISKPDLPLSPGNYAVSASSRDDSYRCESTLTVVDTEPPVVSSKTQYIWPPNHKFHSISIADCLSVDDRCGSEVYAHFTYATSDEVVNGKGDGNHAPDIIIDDCEHVSLRAERAGPQDGRYYTLGYVAEDAYGNRTEGTCQVIVAHDKSKKRPIDSGEKYRVEIGDGAVCGHPNQLDPVVPERTGGGAEDGATTDSGTSTEDGPDNVLH